MTRPDDTADGLRPRWGTRFAAGLLLLAASATPAAAGWTVNARGDCVEASVPSSGWAGPAALLNAPLLPFREAAGGAQLASDATRESVSGTTVTAWPVYILGGTATGLGDMLWAFFGGLLSTVTGGYVDVLPEDVKALTVATIRPRFLTPVPDETLEHCGQAR